MSVRLILVVEGQTEETFAHECLVEHLATFLVFATVSRVETRRHGQKGGMTSYARAKDHIARWMKQEGKNTDVRFSTMFDLYALPKDFPSFERAAAEKDPFLRATILESAFQEDIGDPRFFPYLQVHEFEALLFTDIGRLERYYPDRAKAISDLAFEAVGFATPEHIDDGPETAPSKRIIRQLPEYDGHKPVAGPIVALEIGLGAIRKRCAHFAQWLTRCENLDAIP